MNRLYLRSTEGCGSKKEEEIGSRKQGGELDGTEDPEYSVSRSSNTRGVCLVNIWYRVAR